MTAGAGQGGAPGEDQDGRLLAKIGKVVGLGAGLATVITLVIQVWPNAEPRLRGEVQVVSLDRGVTAADFLETKPAEERGCRKVAPFSARRVSLGVSTGTLREGPLPTPRRGTGPR